MKDLGKEAIEELTFRLNRNKVVLNRFYRSFGLHPDLLHDGRDRRENIGNIFPDTPVKLLKEVFEALKLYDFVEFLEKATKLRIEKISDANRPTKVYSKVEVLIIELCEASETTAGKDAARIGSFFKNLNSQNEITSLTSTFSEKLLEDLQELIKYKSEEESDDRIAEKREAELKTFLERKIPDSWYAKKRFRKESAKMGRRLSVLELEKLGNTMRPEATFPPITDEQLLSVFRKEEPAMRNELKELKEKGKSGKMKESQGSRRR